MKKEYVGTDASVCPRLKVEIVIILMMLLLLLLGGTQVKAATSADGNWEYEKRNSNEVAVKCYLGENTSIEIPERIDNYIVTSIAQGGFNGKNSYEKAKNLTEIKIPNTVISIEDDAFKRCESLTKIKIPNSVTTIGNYVFNGCSSLEMIEIPKSVTDIGYSILSGCTNLRNITVEKGNEVYASVDGVLFTKRKSFFTHRMFTNKISCK